MSAVEKKSDFDFTSSTVTFAESGESELPPSSENVVFNDKNKLSNNKDDSEKESTNGTSMSTKEGVETKPHLPNPPLTVSKSANNSQEELSNGINKAGEEGSILSGKTFSQLLQETEELPETVPLVNSQELKNNCKTDEDEKGSLNEMTDKQATSNPDPVAQEDASKQLKGSSENTTQEIFDQDVMPEDVKSSTPNDSLTANKEEESASNMKSDKSPFNEPYTECDSQSFNLHLSQSQLFSGENSLGETTTEDKPEEDNKEDKKEEEVSETDGKENGEMDCKESEEEENKENVSKDNETSQPHENGNNSDVGVEKVVPVLQESIKEEEATDFEAQESDETSKEIKNKENTSPENQAIVFVKSQIKDTVETISNKLVRYIKSKKKNENLLTECLTLLKEINSLVGGPPLEQIGSATPKVKQQTTRSSLPKPEVVKVAKRKSTTKVSAEISPPKRKSLPQSKKNDDFKNKLGLAVFAKWPICGWYYPGIIEGLGGNKWRETPTVGVFFYDGLRREMKNFNILPADVIPTGSVLCTIDDEAEMTVMTCERESENSVEFTLMKKEKEEGEDEIVKMNFSKLAIKGDSMKIIKQQLEEQHIDVLPKNTNAVSLDNLVCGQRSRGRLLVKKEKETLESPKKVPTPSKKETPKKNTKSKIPERKAEKAQKSTPLKTRATGKSTPSKSTPVKSPPSRSTPAKRSSVSSTTEAKPTKRRTSTRQSTKN